jgi:formylglycine-generating enzyme required for sulfatase activity
MSTKPPKIPGRILPPDAEFPQWNTELGRLCKDAQTYPARSNLAVSRKDGTILVRIPAGEFEMGDGQDSDCPKHKVTLSEYWIGVYCVTNRQYAKFVAETKHRAPDNRVWQKAAKADHPVTDVSWDDCDVYAKWAGLSLPTEAQWEKAARGPEGFLYPWGNEWDEKKCRNDKNKGSGTTAAVWEYPAGASGYGTQQQAGNVWEWCADWWDEGYYGKSSAKDPGGPQGGSYRVFRGGSWSSGNASLFRGASRSRGVPALRYGLQGFRLVRNCP